MKLILVAVAALLSVSPALCGRYSGTLKAQSDGDDPNASGLLNLQTSRDLLIYNSTLFNAFNVTGVHLHLSPTRGAVFGGPLILALTNTSTAPVSANGGSLVQNGQKTSADLAANPMLPNVRTTLGTLGISGNNVNTIGDVANLIEAGVVYSDVHTTVRVSPLGLIRGAISELNCPFPTPQAPTPTTPTSPTPPTPAPTPPTTPTPVRNPCYCTPQNGVGADGFQYCFNFVGATSDTNCNPPSGRTCTVIQASGGAFTQSGGPVYQCK